MAEFKLFEKHLSIHGISWVVVSTELIEIAHESSTNWADPHFSHADHLSKLNRVSLYDSFYDIGTGKRRKNVHLLS